MLLILKNPFIRILLPFIVGIISNILFLNIRIPSIIIICSIIVILYIILLIFHKIITYNLRWIDGFLINFFFFITGLLITHNNTPQLIFNNNSFIDNYFVVQIKEPITEKDNVFSTTAIIKHRKDSLKWKIMNQKCILFFEKDSSSSIINVGDKIIILAKLNEISPPANPNQFDYKKHLKNKGILCQFYVKKDNFIIIPSKNRHDIIYYAIKSRKYLISKIKENGINGDELAVLSALLLGDKSQISKPIKAQYSDAGAMHILCVSGLHVGIVFLILSQSLSFFNKYKTGNKIKAFLMILLIWGYAFITGLSPSVMRASTMITFIIIAQSSNKNTSVYNVLAASAFLLLLIDPYMITYVGFQLSYLAVIGIISFQPIIYNLISPSNIFYDKTWSIISVSIAAQIGTYPITSYYFHQFSNYFIITNLIVIPMSAILLYNGIAVLICSPILYLNIIVSKLASFFLKTMNFFIKKISLFPHSTTENICINIIQVFILYYLIFKTLQFYKNRSFKSLSIILIMIIIYISFNSIRITQQENQIKMTIYQIKKYSCYNITANRNTVIIGKTDLLENKKKYSFSIENHLINSKTTNLLTLKNLNKIDTIINNKIRIYKNHIKSSSKKILILNFNNYKNELITNQNCSHLVIADNIPISINEIRKYINFKIIIFDSSNSFYYLKKMEDECISYDIQYYNVNKNGAYVIQL